jgi:hypothetical protein
MKIGGMSSRGALDTFIAGRSNQLAVQWGLAFRSMRNYTDEERWEKVD